MCTRIKDQSSQMGVDQLAGVEFNVFYFTIKAILGDSCNTVKMHCLKYQPTVGILIKACAGNGVQFVRQATASCFHQRIGRIIMLFCYDYRMVSSISNDMMHSCRGIFKRPILCIIIYDRFLAVRINLYEYLSLA